MQFWTKYDTPQHLVSHTGNLWLYATQANFLVPAHVLLSLQAKCRLQVIATPHGFVVRYFTREGSKEKVLRLKSRNQARILEALQYFAAISYHEALTQPFAPESCW